MTNTIKDRISKRVKNSPKSKNTKSEPIDWYAKAKASIAISKVSDPTKDR